MSTPPEVLIEIDDIRSKIARIKAQLENQHPPLAVAPVYEQTSVSAPASAPEQSSPSASAQINLRQVRIEAEDAYYADDWERAEKWILQWQAAEPDNEDAEEMLHHVKQELRSEELYNLVCKLRDADKWQGAIKVLDRLKLYRDPYKESQKIRVWAETRQRLEPAIVLMHSKNFTKALDLFEQLLQQPDGREYTAQLVATLIEQADVPLEQRARAARMVDVVGDPRPGLQIESPNYWAQPIEPGPFLMGDDNSKESDEKPAFIYHIRQPYALARYPVTNSQYARFLADLERQGKTGDAQRCRPRDWRDNRAPTGFGNHPVNRVSWEDATAFAAWADRMLRAAGMLSIGEIVRLPTEPEWERAAAYPVVLPDGSSGTGRRVYPWGTPTISNLFDTFGTISEYRIRITNEGAVGLFPQEAADCGALDMVGNIWEWCSTPYMPYGVIAQRGQVEPEIFDIHRYVMRGGSRAYGVSHDSPCGYRYVPNRVTDDTSLGFRLARVFAGSAIG